MRKYSTWDKLVTFVVGKALLPLDLLRSGDGDRLGFLRELNETQFLPLSQLRDLQSERLRALVHHAWQHCPFYKRQMQCAGLIPSDLSTVSDILDFPMLSKAEIQSHRHEMVATNQAIGNLVTNQTGGSTGEPISFFLDRRRLNLRAAATMRHDSWAGCIPGSRIAALWGASRDIASPTWKSRLRSAFLGSSLVLDASRLNDDAFLAFDRRLKRFRPHHLIAYAKCIALFARFLQENRLTPYSPCSIITSAETLLDDDRALVEATFGCPVYNRYGCREVSVIASECENRCGLHQCAEHLLVELGDPISQDGSPSQLREVIVTDLMNYAMPLIRYRIGDFATAESGSCACGRGLPRLSTICGRITEFIQGTDGQLISGVFLATYLVARFPAAGRITITQETRSEVIFHVSRQLDADSSSQLLRLARDYLGSSMCVQIVVGKSIETSPSGKFTYCRSSVTQNTFKQIKLPPDVNRDSKNDSPENRPIANGAK